MFSSYYYFVGSFSWLLRVVNEGCLFCGNLAQASVLWRVEQGFRYSLQ
ncbi:hypothetical protein HMPREF6745_0591 [Prevotella sp. oral taxon 472 str. F0295]|nr:hypothetical protein HMPREF6745_0591 [Prevotella sp. oral taxon 472 str. F0295]